MRQCNRTNEITDEMIIPNDDLARSQGQNIDACSAMTASHNMKNNDNDKRTAEKIAEMLNQGRQQLQLHGSWCAQGHRSLLCHSKAKLCVHSKAHDVVVPSSPPLSRC